MRQATITINGRLYDALTGQAISQHKSATQSPAAPSHPAKTFNDIGPRRPDIQRNVAHTHTPETTHTTTHHQEHPAHAVHNKPQRSTTLNRQAIQKPVSAVEPPQLQSTPVEPQEATTTRSPLITRHSPVVVQPSTPAELIAQQTPTTTSANTTPLHPSFVKAMEQRAHSQQTQVHHSSKELKEMLIKERLAEVGNEPPKSNKKGLFARQPKLASILVSSLSLLILGGYFTYVNLTNISMRVAASRAGISAEFPQYRPDGYSLNGPITYAPGEVAISYKSNTNEEGFKLTQKASNWDSQGVLDNYVRKQSNTYLTFQQRGITVYTFNNKAAWTSGGLLYTVDGDASLSSDQILRLATSL